MSFTLNDAGLFNQIAQWDESKYVIRNLGEAPYWTEEEIRKVINDEASIEAFFRNIKICGIPAKERGKIDITQAFIQASRSVGIYGDTYFFKVGNIWRCDKKSRTTLLHRTAGNAKHMSEFLEFVYADENSEAITFETMTINYIAVGDEFFDIEAGKMVSEAPEELRTYALPEVDFRPMKLSDCKSKLMTDLKTYLGEENLKYLMLVTADSMMGMHTADRRAMFIIGETRTGKGTFGKILQKVGLAPVKQLTYDFSVGSDFLDSYADVSSMYPVLYVDEAESINIQKVKKICSDDTMQCNIKGEPALTVINRGVLMFTSNKVPHSNIEGIYEKLAFIKTQGNTFEKKDNAYFEKLTKEDYNEFLCLLLTMCHKLCIRPDSWDNSMMSPEMAEIHKKFIYQEFPTDSFFMNCDKEVKDENGKYIHTKADEYYEAYLIFCNPDTELVHIQDAVAVSKIKPNKAPDGLVGISRQAFASQASVRLGDKTIKGYKYFRGVPPKHSFECDTNIAEFA